MVKEAAKLQAEKSCDQKSCLEQKKKKNCQQIKKKKTPQILNSQPLI